NRASLAALLFLAMSLILAVEAQQPARKIDVSAINLPDNYRIEAIAANLSIPTTMIFDGEDILIAESGYKDTAEPRVLRIKAGGTVEVVVSAGLLPPVTGLLMVDKKLYVSHRGKVSVVEGGGEARSRAQARSPEHPADLQSRRPVAVNHRRRRRPAHRRG